MATESKYENLYFDFIMLDDNAALLHDSYVLRYHVYCEELHFLPVEDYPDQVEIDEFDSYSVHIGAVTKQDRKVIGSMRLVKPSHFGMPMEKHCTCDEKFFEQEFQKSSKEFLLQPSTVEISRFVVSPRYRRRANDSLYALDEGGKFTDERRHTSKPVIPLGIYKTVYQFSKRNGITHWVVAMETPLCSHLGKWQIVFRQIGPTTDYYGPVAPYLIEVADIDRRMSRNLPDLMEEWRDGLEPQHLS